MADVSVISVSELANAIPADYDEAAYNLSTIATSFSQSVVEFKQRVLQPVQQAWQGDAADTALASLSTVNTQLSATEEYLSRFISLLRSGAEGIGNAQAYLRAAQELAHQNSFTIADDGTAISSTGSGPHHALAPTAIQAQNSIQTEIEDLVRRAISTAGTNWVTDASKSLAYAADQPKIAALTSQQSQLEAEINKYGATRYWSQQLSDINSQLSSCGGIAALEQTVSSHPAPGHGTSSDPALYLLSFDTIGNGHAVLSVGDPDAATNIAITVPGTGTNLSTIGGNVNRVESVQQEAQRDGAGTTASIIWQGYDAPQSIPDAPAQHYANTAAPLLADFEKQITAAAPNAHITVIGHSYGSTVVGLAAADNGMSPEDLVFLGSPGVGVDSASDLGVAPGHVWDGTAADDPVPWAPPVNPLHWDQNDPYVRFGVDPASSQFGAIRFEVSDGPGYLDPSVHSDNWNSGSESLKNMGRIVAGQYGLVTTEQENSN